MEVGVAAGGSPELRLVAERVDSCCEGCASSVLSSVSPGAGTLRERGEGRQGKGEGRITNDKPANPSPSPLLSSLPLFPSPPLSSPLSPTPWLTLDGYYLVSPSSPFSCVGVARSLASEITLATILKLTADSVGAPVVRVVGGGG